MKKEEKIDDLAALFLPDLLTPIGNYNINPNSKTDETGFLFGIEQTNLDVPQNPSVSNYYGTDSIYRSQNNVNGVQISRLYIMGLGTTFVTDQGVGMLGYKENHLSSHQPFPNQDYGHTYKDYTNQDFIMPPPNGQRPAILPIQSNAGLSHHQFDNISWILQSELLQSRRPSLNQHNVANFDLQQYMAVVNNDIPKIEPIIYETVTQTTRKLALAPDIPDMHIDYSPQSLLRLLDLNPSNLQNTPSVDIRDNLGQPASVDLKGFLHGRFCTNNHDNYIYQVGLSGSIDEGQVYLPDVISCYRRNFINIHMLVSSSTNQLCIDGEAVRSLRIEIDATAHGTDAGTASFSIRDSEADPKEQCRSGDNLKVDPIGKSHVIEANDLQEENYYMVRKLKFSTSTINSLKLNSQTYFCLTVSLIADLASGSRTINVLRSAPMIVRGRNPSFYNSRKDIVIKPKSPFFRSSYVCGPVRLTKAVSPPEVTHLEDSYEESSDNYQQPKAEEESDDIASDSEDEHIGGSDNESFNDVYIQQILDSIQSTEGKNYHYFPVLNVYYTPPIDVVYFPHGAHLSSVADTVSEEVPREGTTKSTEGGGSGKKKVYFK